MYFPDFLDYQETNANRCYKSTWKNQPLLYRKTLEINSYCHNICLNILMNSYLC